MGFGNVGIDFHGLLKLGYRLIHLSLLGKSTAKVVVGFGIVGIDFQGLLELGHRLVHLSLIKESKAKVVMALQAFRIPGQCIDPERLVALKSPGSLPT